MWNPYGDEWGRDRVNYVVMGIGINVNLEAEDFDDEIREKATSLKIVTGKEIERNRLLASILNQVEKLYTPFKERGDLKETIQICRRESILIGKDVRLIRGDSEEIGKVLDIDEQGQLVVEYADGKIEKVLSGEVSIRGREGYI